MLFGAVDECRNPAAARPRPLALYFLLQSGSLYFFAMGKSSKRKREVSEEPQEEEGFQVGRLFTLFCGLVSLAFREQKS